MLTIPSRLPDQLALIGQLLDANNCAQAMEIIRASKADSPELRNAMGVAMMRGGNPKGAVELYRKLVTNNTGLALKSNAPTVYKANYATALYLTGNVSGALAALSEIGDEKHPTVAKLRTSIAKWRKSLTVWRRIWLTLSGEAPDGPVEFVGAPGDLSTVKS